MAIFYNHIKGCGEGATGTIAQFVTEGVAQGWERTEEYWGWIDWEHWIYRPTAGNDKKIKPHVLSLPKIKINTANDKTTVVDCGHIITSDALYQYITNDFTFNDTVSINKTLTLDGFILRKNASDDTDIIAQTRYDNNIKKGYIDFYNSTQIKLYTGAQGTTSCTRLSHVHIDKSAENGLADNYDYLDINTIDGSGLIMMTSKGVVLRTGGLYVRDLDSLGQTTVDKGVIKADKRCEALYFNATSDRRAKTNITPVQFSALSTVNSLPIYSFNYTSQPEVITIGLIAQEAAERNLDGFSLVDNLNATGQGCDMMQMKESKLVYVLWKAVQELSAEVEELKTEIRNLK